MENIKIESNALVKRRRIIRKINEQIDRYTWSDKEGRFVLDKRGKIVFLDDVIKLIGGGL
jgi:hypothetical protein